MQDGLAANANNNLKTLKLTGEYYYKRRSAVRSATSAPLEAATGALRAGAADGSANFSPDTTGYILEVNYLPWLNTKLQRSTPAIRSSTAAKDQL